MDLNKIVSSVTKNEQVKGLVSSLMSQQGGIKGLMGKLNASGLQEQMRSWVGTGSNQQVSAQQIQEAVGSQNLAEAAQQAGMSPDQAASQLAQALPQLIDQATPEGSLPQQDAPAAGQMGGQAGGPSVPGQAGSQQDTPVPHDR